MGINELDEFLTKCWNMLTFKHDNFIKSYFVYKNASFNFKFKPGVSGFSVEFVARINQDIFESEVILIQSSQINFLQNNRDALFEELYKQIN